MQMIVNAEIINKQSNVYELKLAEMNIKIESNRRFKWYSFFSFKTRKN